VGSVRLGKPLGALKHRIGEDVSEARRKSMRAKVSRSIVPPGRLGGRAAFTLRPVHTRLLKKLKQSTKLGAGARARARAVKKGQLWAYARDERPWAGHAPPGVV
jgi:hypothetical protein